MPARRAIRQQLAAAPACPSHGSTFWLGVASSVLGAFIAVGIVRLINGGRR